jgi:hypothetical protein
MSDSYGIGWCYCYEECTCGYDERLARAQERQRASDANELPRATLRVHWIERLDKNPTFMEILVMSTVLVGGCGGLILLALFLASRL